MWCYCHYKHFSEFPLCLSNSFVVVVFIVYSCDDGVRHSRAKSKRSIYQSRIKSTRVLCACVCVSIMHRIIELLFSIWNPCLCLLGISISCFTVFFSSSRVCCYSKMYYLFLVSSNRLLISSKKQFWLFFFHSWQIVMFQQNDVENIRCNL